MSDLERRVEELEERVARLEREQSASADENPALDWRDATVLDALGDARPDAVRGSRLVELYKTKTDITSTMKAKERAKKLHRMVSDGELA